MSTEDDPPAPPPTVSGPDDTTLADESAPADTTLRDTADTTLRDAADTTLRDDAAPRDTRPAEAATTQPMLEAAPATEESILPLTLGDDALRDAVGARPSKTKREVVELDDDGVPTDKSSRKTMIIAALALVGGLGIAGLVLIGRVNAQRYFLTCTTSQAIAERGRGFPPWGSSPLPGAEWKAIALPPNAQCKPQQVDSREGLEAVFLDLLLERSSATLTAHNLLDAPAMVVAGKQGAGPLDQVSMQLEQALLLSRAPERADQRKQVERLQGDVQYWRASLRLRDATVALTEAARQFDQAALARPMHVSDAGAWAELLRRLSDELHAGPNGVPAGFPPPVPTPDRPLAPQGAALPVEPASDTAGDEPPASTPDAGVPSGGVLL